MCVVKLTIIGSDNGLSPGRRQAIIWTNAGILLNGPLGTNFIQILIGIQTFSFKKMHLKMSSAKWRPFCLGLNVLKEGFVDTGHKKMPSGSLMPKAFRALKGNRLAEGVSHQNLSQHLSTWGWWLVTKPISSVRVLCFPELSTQYLPVRHCVHIGQVSLIHLVFLEWGFWLISELYLAS